MRRPFTFLSLTVDIWERLFRQFSFGPRGLIWAALVRNPPPLFLSFPPFFVGMTSSTLQEPDRQSVPDLSVLAPPEISFPISTPEND